MASLNLAKYQYNVTASRQTTILADSSTIGMTVDSTATQAVLTTFDASSLQGQFYDFGTTIPLMMKLFCYDIVTDSTGAFQISVAGKYGSTSMQRQDTKDFGLTWKVRDWANMTDGNVTVSLLPFSPMTSVSMKCTCGVATDYIDKASEGSY
jgi:hypothetical protein